jgi:hypothetical protein
MMAVMSEKIVFHPNQLRGNSKIDWTCYAFFWLHCQTEPNPYLFTSHTKSAG